MSEVKKVIARLKRELSERRFNPANPICPDCGRREEAQYMTPILKKIEVKVCPECADDDLQRRTGCRFGMMKNCNHEDCKTFFS